MIQSVSGFSRMTKEEKILWLSEHYLQNDPSCISILKQYWNEREDLQRLHDDFIENTLSNFYLPFAVSPNFLINGKMYALPMVIEESSVVAAASQYIFSGDAFRENVGPEQIIARMEDVLGFLPTREHQNAIRADSALYTKNRNMVVSDPEMLAEARMGIYAGTIDGERINKLFRDSLDSPRKVGISEANHKDKGRGQY